MAEERLGAILREARDILREAGVLAPALDARLLVEYFSGTTQSDAIARPETVLPSNVRKEIADAVQRRLKGEPVHRIIGNREFYGLSLALSPDTLEPRPDTETLVSAVLPFAREIARRSKECRILDLGTGTGAVALALLAQVPEATALGVDVSPGAVETAVANAQRLGLAGRFCARQSDWWSAVEGSFHLIVSNPPYISWQELQELSPEVRRFDPLRALDGGADGLDAYRTIAAGAASFLREQGRIAVEIGWRQAKAVEALFAAHGFVMPERFMDLGGNQRVLEFALRCEQP